MNKEIQQRWLHRLILSLLALLIIFMIVQLAPLLSPFANVIRALSLPVGIAALLTYLLHPLVEKLHELGMSRALAVLLIFFFVVFLLVFLAMIGLPAFIKQIQHAFETLPEQFTQIERETDKIQDQLSTLPGPLQEQSQEWRLQLEQIGKGIFDQIEEMALFLMKSMFSFIVIPFLVFFFLKDHDLLQKAAWYLTPRKWRSGLKRYMRDVDYTFGSYIRGQLLVSLSVFIISTIGLWILGVPYPIVLGFFMGVMDLIPYFGPFIGAIPAVIIAFLQSWQLGLLTILLIFIIQQIEGNILSPVIVGKTLHLHPALIILALLVGAEVGGFLGMLIAVPILAIGKVTLLHTRLHFMKD
ncbi:AI-2E family transporter [Halalkalibacter krulwichiae]|uniref:Pheromone autoinducer 2 transporter n=1 Tax=Halalkalibacter krulwichiae TaxID=199441 RepID=A0A1X9MAR0_9BACI|nr:AI-2E family transporter [Halalkalibacter krulwichiae]ARK29243.1 pheromone autoinducer 2 transporter [Halalkalibacter krulwichiae]